MANLKEKLFTDFPPVSTEEWMARITADLKGADFDKKLVWKTNEGFDVNPFYRSENLAQCSALNTLPGEFPFVRGTNKENNWYVRQDISVTDFKVANSKALRILNDGVTSLHFQIGGDDVNPHNINTLLEGIHPEAVELNFTTCHKQSLKLVEILVDYFKSKQVDVMKCFGSVNYDPFKTILKKGIDCTDWVEKAAEITMAAAPLPRFRVLNINACRFNNAGAFGYQELGYALANGNEILSKLIEKGLDGVLVAKKIKFNFAIGANYFMEIAKFRAARLLWSQIVASYKSTCKTTCSNKTTEGECRCACKMYIHADTSTYNMTAYDPYVNMLRTQTEAMSATIAGVNSLTVVPFDESFRDSTDFSERIARNQQLLLKEECHFDKITDPSAGSYYIENLTTSLAEQSWKLFLETDEKGFYEALKAGTVQTTIESSATTRSKALDTRREILLGTNQYPNFSENAADTITKGEHSCGCSKTGTLKPLPATRLSLDFEKLRINTERAGAPKVFMLTIGNLAMRLARSQFACNFFACAGYNVIDNLGFDTVQAGIDAAIEKKADIIVLCSSDDEYVTLAPEAYQLTESNKKILVVAGAPASMDELKAQGIAHFIHVRSNVLDTLKLFNQLLAI
ncbi:MAG: methylmalonyl-CoA mutase small subunit [Bacteroidota bacterium]|jgi:methylmalonyl-CoA mutase